MWRETFGPEGEVTCSEWRGRVICLKQASGRAAEAGGTLQAHRDESMSRIEDAAPGPGSQFGAGRPHRIYCAGPLFNQSERQEMESIARVMTDAGHAVYLPHRDGLEFRLVHEVLVQRGFAEAHAAAFLHEAIFALDVYQLVVECDGIVWNLNGRTPDEGAVSEAAIGWALGMPLVAWTDDVRSLIAGRINPLLAGLVCFRTVEQLEDLPAALEAEFELQPPGGGNRPGEAAGTLPPRARDAVDRGRQLWQTMRHDGRAPDDEAIADAVTELFEGGANAGGDLTAGARTAAGSAGT